MKIIRTVAEMQAQARQWRREGATLGLVPTMGFLHEGHLSLVDACRREGCSQVVVSIFVNPTQFGPNEDLDRYPRDFARDEALCRGREVAAIFYPEVAEMYAPDASTWVTEETLSRPLCGASRPGHFRGVTTVVAKLFNAVLPDVAVFGQKDAQQSLVIRRMARDLHFPVKIVVAPIVREADGLALSSRNKYLSATERAAAPAIFRALSEARRRHAAGERVADTLVSFVAESIAAAGGRVDYIEVRSQTTLEPCSDIAGPAVMAVAAFFGRTRLIDNVLLD